MSGDGPGKTREPERISRDNHTYHPFHTRTDTALSGT